MIFSNTDKENLQLYRRRIIPDECILLKDDEILEITPDYILTKWRALKPGRELHHGMSCYYLDRGFKVSKFCREDGSLMYWYCDIVNHSYDSVNSSLVVTDLLADVIIYPDGKTEILDLAELAEVLEKGSLSREDICNSLRSLDSLLQCIYAGDFYSLTVPME